MSHTPEPEAAARAADLHARTDAIESKPEPPTIPRVTWRLDEIAKALGVSRRVIERERSAGRLPKPDMVLGRMPLWRVETIQDWIGKGGRR
jgi:predicted DNA-binding transcriptional regulator AlpA